MGFRSLMNKVADFFSTLYWKKGRNVTVRLFDNQSDQMHIITFVGYNKKQTAGRLGVKEVVEDIIVSDFNHKIVPMTEDRKIPTVISAFKDAYNEVLKLSEGSAKRLPTQNF